MPISAPTRFFPSAWAATGPKNTIPLADASPLASLDKGFPAITMQDVNVGGIPPEGQDQNGILWWITTILAYMNSGGLMPFDATLSTEISGYHKGAVLMLNDGVTIVQNTTAGNTNDPNSDMTNWLKIATAFTDPQIDFVQNQHVPTTGLKMSDTNGTDHYYLTIVNGVLTQTLV